MPISAVHRLLAPGGAAVRPVARGFSRRARRQRAGSIARCSASASSPTPAASRGSKRSFTRWCAPRKSGFSAQARARREPLAVLDIPLLFETGGERPLRLRARRLGAGPGCSGNGCCAGRG